MIFGAQPANLEYNNLMAKITTEQFTPKGPFDLLYQNQFFNGWPVLDDKQTIVMAFPVEGWQESAAVTITQLESGKLELDVYGAKAQAKKAMEQALAALSLDEDGSGWEKVGQKDPKLGELQNEHHYMRPTLFHSPYEAAAGFVIGHRITIAQGRKIRTQMAQEYGEKFTVEGQDFYAFPTPQKLLKIDKFAGLNQTKIERLHSVAQAAMDGWLDRKHLRALNEEDALAKLETIPGIGPFFSQGILHRGVGSTDAVTHDDLTYHAIGIRYGLGEKPTKEQVLKVAEKWRPYRMWAIVLMHVWLRQSGNLPKRTFSKR